MPLSITLPSTKPQQTISIDEGTYTVLPKEILNAKIPFNGQSGHVGFLLGGTNSQDKRSDQLVQAFNDAGITLIRPSAGKAYLKIPNILGLNFTNPECCIEIETENGCLGETYRDNAYYNACIFGALPVYEDRQTYSNGALWPGKGFIKLHPGKDLIMSPGFYSHDSTSTGGPIGSSYTDTRHGYLQYELNADKSYFHIAFKTYWSGNDYADGHDRLLDFYNLTNPFNANAQLGLKITIKYIL